MSASVTIRPATRQDASELALLMNIAGHGLPLFVWSLDADESVESPFETGRRRAMRDEGSFSWRTADLALCGDEVAGLLVGYRQPDEMTSQTGEGMHPVFAPLAGLEAEAPGTWYVNGLAVYREWRGRGIGGLLLARAKDHARETGARGLSLITDSSNSDTIRFYEHHGFRTRRERPLHTWPGGPDAGSWLLMVKE